MHAVDGSRMLAAGRRRRGGVLVEYTLTAMLYLTFVYGGIEFSWIATKRESILNGCSKAARAAAIGKPLAELRNIVRSGSGTNVPDSYIDIEYCAQDNNTGAWTDATDDYTTGNPPLANDIASGKPIRVRVVRWPYQMLTGNFLSWLPGVTAGKLPMTIVAVSKRE